jgi:hypothetical protein
MGGLDIVHYNYLNDMTTIPNGKTACFVFRIDAYMASMTWSLAYINEAFHDWGNSRQNH